VLPPQRTLLAAVSLYVTFEFPGIVGNDDVNRRETRVVPFWFAAKVH
jgi:hypothetical protein